MMLVMGEAMMATCCLKYLYARVVARAQIMSMAGKRDMARLENGASVA